MFSLVLLPFSVTGVGAISQVGKGCWRTSLQVYSRDASPFHMTDTPTTRQDPPRLLLTPTRQNKPSLWLLGLRSRRFYAKRHQSGRRLWGRHYVTQQLRVFLTCLKIGAVAVYVTVFAAPWSHLQIQVCLDDSASSVRPLFVEVTLSNIEGLTCDS